MVREDAHARLARGLHRGPPDAAVAQAAEVPTRVGPDVDAELFSLYLELSPTPDRQTVTVATGAGRTFTKVFQD